MTKIIIFICCCFIYRTGIAQNNAYILKRAIWHGTGGSDMIGISVCWDNPSDKYAKWMKLVEEATSDTWQKYSSVRFTDWRHGPANNADIHILIKDTVPHTIELGTLIRNRPGGMVLNFDFKNWKIPDADTAFYVWSIAVHEFGHALGFAHEQNRGDCIFRDCILKEDGDNGDWTLGACDTFSVMNYCNPRYNNNGRLSDSDKAAVMGLYGPPPREMNNYDGLSLVFSSHVINPNAKGRQISREFKLYISGSQKDLDKIDHVLYYLDPNWFPKRRRQKIAKNKRSNFGLGLRLWGPVNVVAFVFLNNGKKEFTEVMLPKYLQF